MKKFLIFTTMMLILSINYTNAQTANQYVKWASLPTDPEPVEVKQWYKTALTGGDIKNADVRATSDHYKYVYGEKLFSEIKNSNPESFKIAKAKGNELNWGIGQDGIPVQKGLIAEGTLLIWFNSPTSGWIPVAKWGDNGCLNPASLSKQRDYAGLNDGDDPDITTSKSDPKRNQQSNGTTININGQQGSQELSWQVGYSVYSQGRNDRQNDFVVDASLYKMIQDSKECCNGGGQTQGGGYVVMSASAVQQQRVPLGMTVGGQVIANTVGGILAEGVNRLIYGPQNVRIIGQQFIQYPQMPIGTGPGFPWNNGTGGPSQGGFNSFNGGTLPYNGGQGFPIQRGIL